MNFALTPALIRGYMYVQPMDLYGDHIDHTCRSRRVGHAQHTQTSGPCTTQHMQTSGPCNT